MTSPFAGFSSIWVVLVAARAVPGERLLPLALVARDVCSGLLVEVCAPRLLRLHEPPYPTGPQALLVTIDADGLVGCHLALNWRVPERILDLMIEFRNMTNGHSALGVGGLAGALLWFGRSAAGGVAAGTSPEHLRHRLCAVTALLEAMRPSLDLGRALLRGRYMSAVARIHACGVPVDQMLVRHLAYDWPAIRGRVMDLVDQEFGIYHARRFGLQAFDAWLARHGIAWPRLDGGHLDLGEDTFREMARVHPEVRPLKELRTTLHHVHPAGLTVGQDGRNRTPLRPFASRTGRNQPSSRASVLGTSAWLRHLITPEPGTGLAMIDWQQQEFGIAAALSGDLAMQAAYETGDPYLALAVDAGAAPADATPATHAEVRERFKACALGMKYGMGAARLARQMTMPMRAAEQLIASHRAAFPKFWLWADTVQAHALLHGEQTTVFGWRLAIGADANPRGLRNFPMQANGAEMLRLACCLITEGGIKVCAPHHDALMIEAPLAVLEDAIASTRRLMAEASAVVLDGFALRTSVRVVRAPDRWTDPRGRAVWAAVEHVLAERAQPVRQRDTACAPASPRSIYYYVSKSKD